MPKINHYWTHEQLINLYAQAADDVQEHFEERAAIMEYDGGMDRLSAENYAHSSTTVWLAGLIDRHEAAAQVLARMEFIMLENMRIKDPSAYEFWRTGGVMDQAHIELEATCIAAK